MAWSKALTLTAAVAVLTQACVLSSPSQVQKILSRAPSFEHQAEQTVVPLQLKFGKLFLPATVNGRTREFIFDTGSPTLLSREFADQLGLEILGQSTGRDAHGRAVTMDVALVETLSLGGVSFHQVPVLIFDPRQLELGPCLFDGGVIGSEILPGHVWRIDAEHQRLEIAATLETADAATLTAPLHDPGYPHAPLLRYSIGDIEDYALFDTGNAEQMVFYSPVAQDPAVAEHMQPGSIATGRGSDGISAGGRGEIRELRRFTITGMRLGEQRLGPMRATTRDTPPTLIGAGLLARYIVTLDMVTDTFILQDRQAPITPPLEPGYRLGIVDGKAVVTQLFDDTAAARAGLRLGDQVVSVNGHSLVAEEPGEKTETVCQTFNWLAHHFVRTAEAEVVVNRKDRRQVIRIPAVVSSEGTLSQRMRP